MSKTPLHYALFTDETFPKAVEPTGTIVCGYSKRFKILDEGTEVLLMYRDDETKVYKNIGIGVAKSEPVEDKDRFGERFRHTVELEDVVLISDRKDWLPSPLKSHAFDHSKGMKNRRRISQMVKSGKAR